MYVYTFDSEAIKTIQIDATMDVEVIKKRAYMSCYKTYSSQYMFRFWLRSDYKNTILVKTVCGRAARAARLTAEAQNLERSGPYMSVPFRLLSTQARRDGGEMEARRRRAGGELEARRRRRWRRDGRCRRETGARWRRDGGETGARWRRRRDEGGGDEGGESGEAGY